MAVASKTVQGRRKLKFQTMDQFVADAKRLAFSPQVKMLGNWSLSELLSHLTLAINGSIDGIPGAAGQVRWYIRLFAPLLKRRVLSRGLPVGFKLPRNLEANFFPTGSSAQEAFRGLQRAVDRLQNEKMTVRHIPFGKLTHEQWIQFHLRHAELHLSFAVLPAAKHSMAST